MNKTYLVPKLAIEGIKKNGNSYLPYILITSFSVFIFFNFNAICDNPIMKNIPHADYMMMLMYIGRVLLGLILAPLLISTNRFLIKQRKSELGLYNVLGLDQKYIGAMMLVETLVLYVMTLGIGMLVAMVFSKLVFLLLLNLAGLSTSVPFTGSVSSYVITISYFGVTALLNLGINLWEVMKAKPIELMKSSQKGEKQEKHLGRKALIGVGLLAVGYASALISKVNSLIFLEFFLAVELVVLGTQSLFKSGTIAALLKLKKTPNIYYQKQNFITISDMLYRMKRNAKSLANICIFSTMIMITLLCTASLFLGENPALRFNYPMDVAYDLDGNEFKNQNEFEEEVEALKAKYQVTVKDQIIFRRQMLAVLKEGNQFVENKERDWFLDNSHALYLISLEDYNKLSNSQVSLKDNEALIFCNTKNFNDQTVLLNDQTYQIKEELDKLCFESKQPRNLTGDKYYLVLKDENQIAHWAEEMSATGPGNWIYCVRFNLEGNQKKCDAFIQELDNWVLQRPGGVAADYVGTWEQDTRPMYGALLFLGIFFGIIFSGSLLLLMYYKQVTEGFEDKKNFKILKQVGMSDEEIRKTIKRQILTVFFLPLIGAIVHTFVGMHMVNNLMCTIHVYDRQMIFWCSIAVMSIFSVLYILSYSLTSKAYYRIVK